MQHAKYKYDKTKSCNMQQANKIKLDNKKCTCKYNKTKPCNIHI